MVPCLLTIHVEIMQTNHIFGVLKIVLYHPVEYLGVDKKSYSICKLKTPFHRIGVQIVVVRTSVLLVFVFVRSSRVYVCPDDEQPLRVALLRISRPRSRDFLVGDASGNEVAGDLAQYKALCSALLADMRL